MPWADHPVLKRELLGILRSPRTFWLLVLAVAATGLLPALGWPGDR